MKQRIYIAGFLLTVLIASSGCKKYLNINSDPDTTQAPSVASVFPAMLAAIPRGTQFDARYVGKYIQNWLTLNNNNNDVWDTHGYVANSDASGDIWRQTYYGLGKNLDYIITSADRDKKYDYVGAALALKAYMFQTATDYHGEIIYTEAFKENTYYFKYDTQDIVYKGVDSLCRVAIKYLELAEAVKSTNTLSLSDYSYGGDVTKWKRFVYGILARNYNHLSNKASYNADSVIKFCNNALTSINDDFVIPFDASKNDDANFFGPYRDNLTSFRQSNFIVRLLDGTALAGNTWAENRDPRMPHMISASADTSGTNNGGYRGVNPGTGDPLSASTSGANFRKRVPVLWADSTIGNPSAATFLDNGKYLFKNKAVMPVMTFSEISFIKAEAEFRKNNLAGAHAAYLAGINAHFDFINRNYSSFRGAANLFNGNQITTTQRNTYLASRNVKQTAAALTMTDIMLQKYISGWCWNWVETWVDLRRFHYTDLDPATNDQVFKTLQMPTYAASNLGNPVQRVRPRYNSEYVWNLDELRKFGGDKTDYHTYEMWFSKP